jgi:hypothetical protein
MDRYDPERSDCWKGAPRKSPAGIRHRSIISNSWQILLTGVIGDAVIGGDSLVWIEDAEKYALVGLNVNVDEQVPRGQITAPFLVFFDEIYQ